MGMAESVVKSLREVTGIDFVLAGSTYDSQEETLHLSVGYAVQVPLEYITVTLDLPEGMTISEEELEELASS